LDWTVETVLVNELCSGLVCLGVLAHLNQILVMSWWIGVVFNGPKLALPHEVVYSGAPSTVMPMERAVPAMIAAPASMSRALRSFFLVSAISLHCSQVTEPTLSVCGTPEPFLMPAAFSSSLAAGGDFRMKSNERSS